MDELISVIVPVYNAEKYIEDCIQSVLNQTYRNLELILIDDGSRDAGGKVCADWAQKDPRVRYVRQENGGVGAARNRGLEMAQGTYAAFLDADDTLDPSFCEKMREILGEDGEIAFCQIRENYADGTATPMESYTNQVAVFPTEAFEYWQEKEKRSSCGTMYKRNLLGGLSFSDSLYVGEDTLFLAQAIVRTRSLIYYDAPLYNYRVLPESAYHGSYDRKKKTEIDAWQQICRVFPEGSVGRLSAEAKCAEISINMIRNYVDDPGFDRETVRELLRIYRGKLPQLVRYDRRKHRSCWKHILIALLPDVFVQRQKGVKK